MTAKLIFLSGSIRKESTNTKLAQIGCNIAKSLGADAEFVDLKDFDMPIYNGDLEEEYGLPENAKKLKKLFAKSHGFFIASPEYNSSFSALLKNALDWISRPENDSEAPLIAFAGKVAAISSASPGGLGGLRGLVPLRMMLGNIRTLVIPEQFALAGSFQAFEGEEFKDAKQKEMFSNVIQSFVNTANKNI